MGRVCNIWHMSTTNGTADAEQLLTPRQVAARLNVSRSTVSRWSIDGTLTPVRIGNNVVRYRRADVEALYQPESAS